MYRIKHWLVEVFWRQKLPNFWPAFKRTISSPATIAIAIVALIAFGGGLQLNKLFESEKSQLAYDVEFALKEPYERPEFVVESWLDDDRLPEDDANVSVIVFWSTSCLRCRDMLAAATEWQEKYAELGLSTTTVHIPEFNFEADKDLVKRWATANQLELPVAIDNEYKIADAFEVGLSPSIYFIDSDNMVRHVEFSSKNFAHSERVIQRLLEDKNVFHNFEAPPTTAEDDPLQSFLVSEDMYVGTDWLGGFAQSEQNQTNQVVDFNPIEPEIGQYSLEGRWLVGPESIVSASDKSIIKVRFVGDTVHILAGADNELHITLNNYAEKFHAKDVKDAKIGVQEDKFYHLLSLGEVDKQGLVELTVPRGVEIYKFSFQD